MTKHGLLLEAAAGMAAVVDKVGDGELGLVTPCAGWDVRGLFAHLLEWGPSLEGAARKEAVAPGSAGITVREQVERLADAWGRAAAWEGGTSMAGMELPAELVGGMVLGEFVLHGWDLARAVSVPIAFSDDVLRLVYDELARSADQGRSMGVYGAEVPVAPDAPLLDRVLGLSGRDPQWTAAEQ